MTERNIRGISEWLGSEVTELNVREDHGYVEVSISPKVSVLDSTGMIKGKTAIKLFKSCPGMRKKPYRGNHFWVRGYFISTIGVDDETIRKYVRYQEQQGKREEDDQGSFRLL